MKKMTTILAVLSLCFIGTARASYPPEFTAIYQLNKLGMNAAETRITHTKQTDGSWLYKSQTQTKGLISIFRKDKITERTQLNNITGSYKPVSYDYIHQGSKKNRNRSIAFDWQNKTANINNRGKRSSFAIADDVADSFSLQLKIMSNLDDNNRQLDYNIIHKGQLKAYQFEILGEDIADTAAGNFKAIKWKRTRKQGKRTTIMWLAPELHYLPVRIQHIEKDGTNFSLTLSHVSGAITKGKKFAETATENEDE